MNKKVLAVFVMAFALAACGQNQGGSAAGGASAPAASAASSASGAN